MGGRCRPSHPLMVLRDSFSTRTAPGRYLELFQQPLLRLVSFATSRLGRHVPLFPILSPTQSLPADPSPLDLVEMIVTVRQVLVRTSAYRRRSLAGLFIRASKLTNSVRRCTDTSFSSMRRPMRMYPSSSDPLHQELADRSTSSRWIDVVAGDLGISDQVVAAAKEAIPPPRDMLSFQQDRLCRFGFAVSCFTGFGTFLLPSLSHRRFNRWDKRHYPAERQSNLLFAFSAA